MIGSTELPVLEMHPSGALVMHEEWDPLRVKKLTERLLGEKVLKKPSNCGSHFRDGITCCP